MEETGLLITYETDKEKEETLDFIMIQYGKDILQLAYTYVKDLSQAEDLAQEIFIKCFRHLDSFKQQANVKTWLYRIASNHCKDYLKSWHHRKVTVNDKITELLLFSNHQVDEEVIKKDEDEELVEAVFQLKIKYREVIYLYYYEDFSIKEISQALKVNENTVKTRLKRARQLLKEILYQED
ncbi:sigma-70 family RNA polymerase sigma factor [Desulforamulus ruminis]|uniref:RNA polymerase sigma factor, sigma-70 family n=1 Tax=Desulforamulus ruminis (strain ATCC 23193 / DSM 2154 / NCIMB 8452 / DL) TaxID=696281 RepID=F6DVB8_DESRL|nr:sigma-70 family RNA polymerase sigma factor [Desulforamulus ruminis]AEG60271.1 RNA polymerase sigma factor, sigma-70 family [Desulforamulus ruminis DSM 2154]